MLVVNVANDLSDMVRTVLSTNITVLKHFLALPASRLWREGETGLGPAQILVGPSLTLPVSDCVSCFMLVFVVDLSTLFCTIKVAFKALCCFAYCA